MWAPFGAYIGVLDGNDDCDNLACTGEHSFDGHLEKVVWCAQPRRTYRRHVHCWIAAKDNDNSDTSIDHQKPVVSNTMCTQANVASVNSGVILGLTSGPGPDEVPNCILEPLPSPGAWYDVFVAEGGRHLQAKLNGFYTHYDTKISFFEGTCWQLQCVEWAPFESRGRLNLVSWYTTANAHYKVLVHQTFGEYGLVSRLSNPLGTGSGQSDSGLLDPPFGIIAILAYSQVVGHEVVDDFLGSVKIKDTVLAPNVVKFDQRDDVGVGTLNDMSKTLKRNVAAVLDCGLESSIARDSIAETVLKVTMRMSLFWLGRDGHVRQRAVHVHARRGAVIIRDSGGNRILTNSGICGASRVAVGRSFTTYEIMGAFVWEGTARVRSLESDGRSGLVVLEGSFQVSDELYTHSRCQCT